MNTNSGSKLFVCSTAQPNVLNLAGYQALAWVLVGGVGSVGEIGNNQNVIEYDTWDDDVVDKGKGMTNAGSPEVEVTRRPSDAGQIILRAQALVNLTYAFKIQRNDPATVGGNGTIIFNRGLVVGPRRPQGRNEDIDLEIFTLAYRGQKEIVVDPT